MCSMIYGRPIFSHRVRSPVCFYVSACMILFAVISLSIAQLIFDGVGHSYRLEWMHCDSAVKMESKKNWMQLSTWHQLIDVLETNHSLDFNWMELEKRFVVFTKPILIAGVIHCVWPLHAIIDQFVSSGAENKLTFQPDWFAMLRMM